MQRLRHSLIRSLVGLVALLATVAPAYPARADEPTRVTTSFEAEHVALVIKRVAKIFSGGFGRVEAERVAAQIDKLRSDEEGGWQFTAIFRKKPVPLHIRAVMDDMAMVDLDFSTEPDVAARIRHEIDAVSSERGL